MSDRPSIKIPFEPRQHELLRRSSAYGLLANLLSHPKSRAVSRHPVQTYLETWREMSEAVDGKQNGRLYEFAGRLRRLLDAISDDDWARKYEDCFGHTAHSKISPYELEYGEEHSYRQPQELADITAFYRAFGLRVSKSSKERADHVSVECEFMYFILVKEFFALANGEKEHAAVAQDAGRRFLSDHLARWMPAFAARLEKEASCDWLKSIAEFSLCFIRADCEVLGIKTGSLNMPLRAVNEKIDAGCISCLSPASHFEGNS